MQKCKGNDKGKSSSKRGTPKCSRQKSPEASPKKKTSFVKKAFSFFKSVTMPDQTDDDDDDCPDEDVSFWTVWQNWMTLEGRSQATERNYRSAITDMLQYFKDVHDVDPNDLTALWSQRLRLMPSMDGYLVKRREEGLAIGMEQHATNAYASICKALLAFIEQWPEALRGQGLVISRADFQAHSTSTF